MAWASLRIEPDDDPGGGIVRVDVEVDGHMLDLVLDTGAAGTTLSADDWTNTLPDSGKSSSGTVFGRTVEDRVEVSSLRFAGLEHGPLVVGRGHRSDGQLGLDVLAQHVLHLDLDSARIGLDEGDHVGAPHTLLLGRASHPHLTLHWQDVNAYAVLDTGSSVTVVDSGFAHRNPFLLNEIGASHGTDAAGIQQDGQIHTIAGPTIEGLEFAAHTAAIVDLAFVNEGAARPVDLIVGYPMLRQAVWTLDLPGGTWSARMR